MAHFKYKKQNTTTLLLWIIVFLGALSSTNAQKASAAADRNSIVIGQPIQITVSVSGPNGVRLPNIAPTYDNLEVIKADSATKVSQGNEVVLSQKILVTAYDSGRFVFPPLQAMTPNGQPLMTDSIVITADYPSSVKSNPDSLAGIKPILSEPATLEDYLPYIIGAAVALLLTLLGWLYYRWQKRRVKPVPKPVEIVKLPSHEIALAKLKNLAESSLLKDGHLKEYYSDLTFIIREYIEDRYQIPALESTSEELLRDLDSMDLGQQRDSLRLLLQTADLVKFAKSTPTMDMHQEAMDRGVRFVEGTIEK